MNIETVSATSKCGRFKINIKRLKVIHFKISILITIIKYFLIDLYYGHQIKSNWFRLLISRILQFQAKNGNKDLETFL